MNALKFKVNLRRNCSRYPAREFQHGTNQLNYDFGAVEASKIIPSWMNMAYLSYNFCK
jgi:hypothetical protein